MEKEIKEIKEGIEVNVKETPDKEPKIKDFNFGMNTMTSGLATFITEHYKMEQQIEKTNGY